VRCKCEVSRAITVNQEQRKHHRCVKLLSHAQEGLVPLMACTRRELSETSNASFCAASAPKTRNVQVHMADPCTMYFHCTV
jgi:hypothetical protein